MTNPIKTTSTSKSTAMATPVVLRETSTTRLQFVPLLLDNSNNPKAAVKGELVFQHKAKTGAWEDHSKLPLSSLKADEFVKVPLSSEEVLLLFEGLDSLYQLAGQHGVKVGVTEFAAVPDLQVIKDLLQDPATLTTALGYDDMSGEMLKNLLSWLAEHPDAIAAAEPNGLTPEHLARFEGVFSLAYLKRFATGLDKHLTDPDEEAWQKRLKRYAWIIAQVFAIPVALIDEKVYVSGKNITNTGGNTIDFLYQNTITHNPVLIEIKTPMTKLVGGEYRNNFYKLDGELVGATMQLAGGVQQLTQDYRALADGTELGTQLFRPRGLLIVGKTAGLDADRLRSFELYRGSQTAIEIITFDELLAKVTYMIELFEGGPA